MNTACCYSTLSAREDVICQVNYILYIAPAPIPVAARSKAWVCDSSVAGISGSNPHGCLVVSLSVVSVISCHVEVSASGPSRGVLPNVVCLSVIVNHRQWGGPFTTILAPE